MATAAISPAELTRSQVVIALLLKELKENELSYFKMRRSGSASTIACLRLQGRSSILARTKTFSIATEEMFPWDKATETRG